MKKLFGITLMFIILGFGVNDAKAQSQYGRDLVYGAFSGGSVSFLNTQQASPTFGLRFGLEVDWLVGELEINYLSVGNSVDGEKSLSTMTAGVNFGVKLVQGRLGYLAGVLSTGYALQEDWRRGKGCDYGYYGCGYSYDYDYCHYNCCRGKKHHDKAYFGIGLSGVVDVCQRFGFFVEGRLQNIPVEGKGKTKWGLNTQLGMRFYIF